MNPGRVSVVLLLALASCATARKLDRIVSEGISPVLVPARDTSPQELSLDICHSDTIKVTDAEGNDLYLMSAVIDDDGEMMANETLNAAVKIASFKNASERNGKVDLRFSIIVPEALQDGRWQLRFTPSLHVLGDTTRLDRVFITGDAYRRQQLRGYQLYNDFLSTIITDSTEFIRQHELKVFLERNMSELPEPRFGVGEAEAAEHYTDRIKEWMNLRRLLRKDLMYKRFIKSPIVTEGLRLDSIVRSGNGEWKYEYVQTIRACPGLRKAQISLSGTVNDIEREVMEITGTQPLDFYISSLSSLIDGSPRYRTKVIARRVTEQHSYSIVFGVGKTEIDRSLEENDRQLKDLDFSMVTLLNNHEFDVDSVVVCATASPEGSYATNRNLSQRRGGSICGYINGLMDYYLDSVRREEGVRLTADGTVIGPTLAPEFSMVAEVKPENWEGLAVLVGRDGYLTDEEKRVFFLEMEEPDPDIREMKMSTSQWFPYVRESLYPRLRTVNLKMCMHRRDMLQDTVLTKELDSLYLRGVQMIRDRDYKQALAILRPYSDFNTAVACLALDYNASAEAILDSLDTSASTEYLMAIVKSRRGDEAGAMQHYLNACNMEASFIHRGNLDPEIASLIRKYKPKLL